VLSGDDPACSHKSSQPRGNGMVMTECKQKHCLFIFMQIVVFCMQGT